MPDANPVVSCIMPTADRAEFVPQAIACFLAQDFDSRELVVLDSGAQSIKHLLPDDPRIRYARIAAGPKLGELRNQACELARGTIIVHWDDDDWYPSDRISRQMARLGDGNVELCATSRIYFLDSSGARAWEYCSGGARPWLAGSSFAYRRTFWERHKFQAVRVGEDATFAGAITHNRIADLADPTLVIATVHACNTSPKRPSGSAWKVASVSQVLGIKSTQRSPVQTHNVPVSNAGPMSKDDSKQRRDNYMLPTPIIQSDSYGAAKAKADGLSVVIPFGGRDRLRLLAATLASLRQSAVVDQIIIAEVGDDPVALDLARRWDADYMLVSTTGPFDKARALNTGSLLAHRPEILWCDGDLLFGEDFLARAQQEIRTRGLDFLFPFSRIDYLDAAESKDVCAGSRNPADCRAMRRLQPVRGGAIGGMGVVREQFLRRHGGMIEGFFGWGGEDNAWVHKASLLGRVGVTQHTGQVAWHLYHPESGATGAQPWRSNPHYARNVELLARVQRIRAADELLRQFPPPACATPPWPIDASLVFLVIASDPDSPAMALATTWMLRLNEAYGCTVQLIQTGAVDLTAMPDSLEADVVVGFVDNAAACLTLAASLRNRLAIMVPSETDPNFAGSFAACSDQPWMIARTAEQVACWQQCGLKVWHRPINACAPDASTALPVLVQPLSYCLRAHAIAQALLPVQTAARVAKIVVWTYWEGPMPDWIARCLETARRHAPTLRVLGPSDFDALWDRDRDIDLSRLHVAQRADFVRAFLLMRFGGLWLDADCIVMRDLSPLLDQLSEFEFIAHRERQGYFSNAFFAAKLDSALAARFYEAVCARLRDRRPLSWIALGNELLTVVLKNAPESYLELPVEHVQPICWSQPERFFKQADDAEHECCLDPQAWCFMLSQQNIIRYHKAVPTAALTADRSLFSFLLRRSSPNPDSAVVSEQVMRVPVESINIPEVPQAPAALTQAFSSMCNMHSAEGQESVSGPGSSMRQTAEIRRLLPLLLQHIDARVILDAPCGDFHWMNKVHLGVDTYVGIDLLEDLIRRNRERYSSRGRRFATMNLLKDRLPKVDVVLCRDCLVHMSYKDIIQILTNIVASGSRYLLTTTFPDHAVNVDISTGQWRPLNLQVPPFSLPPPLHILNEKCSESGGAFKDKSLGLWQLSTIPLQKIVKESPVLSSTIREVVASRSDA
jgi:hypothetical protein